MSALPAPEPDALGGTELLKRTVSALDQAVEIINDLRRQVTVALFVANLEATPEWQAELAAVAGEAADEPGTDAIPRDLLAAYLEADKHGEKPADYIPRIRQQFSL